MVVTDIVPEGLVHVNCAPVVAAVGGWAVLVTLDVAEEVQPLLLLVTVRV